MTLEEANELFKEATVRFSSYYKYAFNYSGNHGGYRLHATYGGTPDDIYRYEVEASKDIKVVPIEANWNWFLVTLGEVEVFSYREW